MSIKDEVASGLQQLLESAQHRGTNQGQLICTGALARLQAIESDHEVLEVLRLVNDAYTGIEAHGYLTAAEYSVVCHFRDLTANQSLEPTCVGKPPFAAQLQRYAPFREPFIYD